MAAATHHRIGYVNMESDYPLAKGERHRRLDRSVPQRRRWGRAALSFQSLSGIVKTDYAGCLLPDGQERHCRVVRMTPAQQRLPPLERDFQDPPLRAPATIQARDFVLRSVTSTTRRRPLWQSSHFSCRLSFRLRCRVGWCPAVTGTPTVAIAVLGVTPDNLEPVAVADALGFAAAFSGRPQDFANLGCVEVVAVPAPVADHPVVHRGAGGRPALVASLECDGEERARRVPAADMPETLRETVAGGCRMSLLHRGCLHGEKCARR